MEDDFKDLKQDVKEIKADISEIKTCVVSNTVSLDHHMRRTELNETRIKNLEYWLLGLLAASIVAVIRAKLH